MRNTTGNSRPFAECSVISVTVLWSGSVSSMSVTSEIASRNACTRSRPCGTSSVVVALADAADRDEPAELALVDLVVELARGADELLQVLDPALRLDRPLGLELGEVAALREHRLERARRRRSAAAASTVVHQLEQVLAGRRAPCR